MIRKIPRSVLVALLLMMIPLGAGIGWELAGLSERVSGRPVADVSAAIGGAICLLWFLLGVVGDFRYLFSGTTKSKVPVRPNAAVLGQKEEA
jgi:hypothetical protein